MPSPPESQAVADWCSVRTLFEQCLELDQADRARHLQRAAVAVRDEVESLLRERDQNAGRLDPDHCHGALLTATTAAASPGSRIGPYRIVAVIGRGGMGTVYLAQEGQPQRQVALKVLAAAVSGSEAERRFRLEAELLGRLRHDGIAQIYAADVHEQQTDLGTVRWPFFAMEYVEGANTLAAWAAARPRGERELLVVFLQVCAAVQHAHERGVVHRDLKPQNVLIGPGDRVKVIDFGIARSIDRPAPVPGALTHTGQLLGTLHYMSPEQIRGDGAAIDTRTDVHALGVVLYELLTGRLPFDLDGRSLPDIGRVICEAEPRPLRAVRPDLDADLELILATAMAKQPQRRYSTAGSLAEDLERHLQREPIRARPPSLGYQLAMFARRRRGLVTAVAALLLVSTVGGATSLLFMVRAQHAERQAVLDSQQKAAAMRVIFDSAMRTVLELPDQLSAAPDATRLKRKVLEDASLGRCARASSRTAH
jgi:serine/threonine protein kinase